jgi:hypothetical protein
LGREPSVGVKRVVEGCWEVMFLEMAEKGLVEMERYLEERECDSSGTLWLRGGGRGGLIGSSNPTGGTGVEKP